MKFIALLLLVCGAIFSASLSAQTSSLADPGPYAVGYRDLSFTDASLASPNVTIRLYYPATSAGSNTPVASGSTFARVAFGHGFNLNYLDYEEICGHLASHGYLVVTPDVQNGFSVDHLEYARELAACLKYLEMEGAAVSSDFFQRVDTMAGVAGHSMGGGASALVPGVYPTIDAVSGLAAAETNPSAISALGGYAGPFQTISGDADNTAPEASNQTPMYNAATGPRQWVSLLGGAHCKFTDGTTICDLVSSSGSISRAEQIERTQKYLTAFFHYFLQGDATAQTYICGDSVQADVVSGILLNTTTVNCVTVGTAEPSSVQEVFPNPFQNNLRIKGGGAFQVIDPHGNKVWSGEVSGVQMLDTRNWSNGMYWLVGEDGKGKVLVKQD